MFSYPYVVHTPSCDVFLPTLKAIYRDYTKTTYRLRIRRRHRL